MDADVNIVYDTEVFDDGNSFDNTTGIFTAPKAGIYHFEAQIEIKYSGNQSNYISIYVNNAEVARFTKTGSNNDLITLNVSKTLKLSVDDTVTIRLGGTSGLDFTTGRIFSYFSGHYVR